jgi:hypothetical protein
MKVPQHPNVAKAVEALERGNSDEAWHLLRYVPKDFLEVPEPEKTNKRTLTFRPTKETSCK